MIRLVFPLRRKPGLSVEEFQDYWKPTIHRLSRRRRRARDTRVMV